MESTSPTVLPKGGRYFYCVAHGVDCCDTGTQFGCVTSPLQEKLDDFCIKKIIDILICLSLL